MRDGCESFSEGNLFAFLRPFAIGLMKGPSDTAARGSGTKQQLKKLYCHHTYTSFALGGQVGNVRLLDRREAISNVYGWDRDGENLAHKCCSLYRDINYSL